MNNKPTPEQIARAIFAVGDEPDSPTYRIQFMGGHWPDNEKPQGGLAEKPLASIIGDVFKSSESTINVLREILADIDCDDYLEVTACHLDNECFICKIKALLINQESDDDPN